MSEHIVHTAILEDSFAIAAYLEALSPDFRRVMARHLDFARLGCVTVSGDQFSFRLLEQYKEFWKRRDDLTEAKLAFVLGWVSHRACDRQMKPIWKEPGSKGRGSDVDPALSPTDCSVYHEGLTYRLYYADDPVFRCAIFDGERGKLPGAELLELDAAAEMIEDSFAMNLMEIQTLPPGNGQPFFEELCMRAQKFYVDIDRYVRSAGDPDPLLVERYLTDIHWYGETDEIVAVAMKLRRGEAVTEAECAAAMAARPLSHYGQALRLSLSYIVTASAYFAEDEMSIDTLKERLDIGRLGPDGLRV